MAGDRPAPYDYILLVGGPLPIGEWPRRDRELFAAFVGGGTPLPGGPRDKTVVGAAS
jgi:hypothetical protein